MTFRVICVGYVDPDALGKRGIPFTSTATVEQHGRHRRHGATPASGRGVAGA